MISKSSISVLLFNVIVFIAINDAESQSMLKNCKKLVMQVAKKQLKLISTCTKEIRETGLSAEEVHAKFQCVIKCAMQKEGLIDENHKVSVATLQKFFDKYMPEEFHEVAHSMMEGCVDEFAPLMNADDPLCKAQGDFVKCAQNFVAELCP